jgi:hypothetical protein
MVVNQNAFHSPTANSPPVKSIASFIHRTDEPFLSAASNAESDLNHICWTKNRLPSGKNG